MHKKTYGGLDLFRPAAALLVVAIHTSPLASFSNTADFFFTRVLSRIAVPFFFMVTGQFVLSEQISSGNPGQKPFLYPPVLSYVKKLCILYLSAILLYLPLGIYAGHYRNLTPYDLVKMLLFDGTFYHLWYFPACILGIGIISVLARFFGESGTVAIAAALYLFGLLGDSYYGLTEKLPPLSACYEALFRLFSYTRNGLLFAPLFLILGARIRPLRPARSVVGLVLSFAAMTAEAFLLRDLGFQRHDSMYLFLIPVSYFLYCCLLSVPAASRKCLRRAATWIYLLHPAFIVVVRAIAKPLHLTELLVENSIVHYAAVAFLSIAAACLLTAVHTGSQQRKHAHAASSAIARQKRSPLDRRIPQRQQMTSRAYIELDMKALEHNVRYLQSLLPEGCKLMPAVKANAYGHGAVPVAKELNRLGIDDFCVACAAEGVELRLTGVKGQILILGYTDPSLFPLLRRYHLTQTVVDYSYARRMEESGQKLSVHIAVDTGMHRLGIPCGDIDAILSVYQMENLKVTGIFTHLAACDGTAPEHRAFTERQIQSFADLMEKLRAAGQPCTGAHVLSSYGILNYPQAAGAYIRPGIALYGVPSFLPDPPRRSSTAIFDSASAVSDSASASGSAPTVSGSASTSGSASAVSDSASTASDSASTASDSASTNSDSASTVFGSAPAVFGSASASGSTSAVSGSETISCSVPTISDFSALRPILTLKARIVSIRTIPAGEFAGYGLAFTAKRETRIAVLSIGYADGLPRMLSESNGSVLICGQRAPIIGRICMDQTLTDVTDIPAAAVGETAVLIGRSGALEITAADMAAQCNTITNEILSRLGARLPRITV